MQTRNIEVSGAIVFWSCGPTQREMLEARMAEIGLDRFAPKARTDAAALRASVAQYCATQLSNGKGSPDRRVEPLKKTADGVEVVEIDRGTEGNHYDAAFSAKIDDNGQIVVTRGYADAFVLRELHSKVKGVVTGPGVSRSLVDLLNSIGGTALRPTGGVYWIPQDAVELWEKVAVIIEACPVQGEKSAVYMVRTLMDSNAVRAVRDAIIHEIEVSAEGISKELLEGGLGDDAIETRKKLAGRLHERIALYEGILGEGLSRLHTAVSSVEESMTIAALATL